MPRCTRRAAALLLASLLPTAVAGQYTPAAITLEQIMADPDWIGPPVEQAWWGWDSQHVLYTQKRLGSPIRDTYQRPRAAAEAQRAADADLAAIDTAAPVFDRARRRMAFLRNGDVFLRDLASGRLQQVTRSPEEETGLSFSADDRDLLWRVGTDWFRALPGQAPTPAALPRAQKDPRLPPPSEPLSAHQLRLSSALQRDKAQREALAAEAERLRQADPTRAIAPVYLGDEVNLVDSALSPAGRWLLAVVEAKDASTGRVGKMPKYVTESGYEEVEDVRPRVGRTAPIAQGLRLIDLASGAVRKLSVETLPGIHDDPLAALRQAAGQKPLAGPRPLRVTGLHWNAAGTALALQLRAIDNKDRWLATVDFDQAELRPQHRLHDPAWINDGASDNPSYNDFGWLPDDQTLWYLSEESGWSHLYTLAAGGRPVALTAGRWEATRVQWSAEGERAYFYCNRAGPDDYEVCGLTRGSAAIEELTALDGVEDFSLSPDGQQLLVRYSSSYTPAQLAVVPVSGGAARPLTDTRTADYRARSWLTPQFVTVPSTHGAGGIAGKLYRPTTLTPGKKYPLVLFVHGAGYLQNVHRRFPYYFREQMFHNFLVQQGYLVLELDYRGSAGYGRDWRTAIYRQMGHPELEDYRDGVDYLVAEHQGDAGRVGIYGGSYGGFLSLMALFRAPEVFSAGAALRPVTDWTSYHHEYTSNILNSPELDPEAYRVSSPIEYAEHFRGHLLIGHGMIDDNVLYQDSVRLAQRLIELRKDHWELASYPLERHSYQHPESWYDQYRRIFQLFKRGLK